MYFVGPFFTSRLNCVSLPAHDQISESGALLCHYRLAVLLHVTSTSYPIRQCHFSFFKVTRERKILEVSVDKGMEDGQKITFSGEGDQEPGLEPGDIIIVLDEKEHSIFKRNGIDLIMKMQISLSEALTGLKKTIQTLDSRTLVIQTVSGKFVPQKKLFIKE